MVCIFVTPLSVTATPICDRIPFSKLNSSQVIFTNALLFQSSSRAIVDTKARIRFRYRLRAQSNSQIEHGEDEIESLVQDLRVPDQWLAPSKALEESEWLKATLHKWLDDEFCPEETNVEISEVAARSFYNSLVEKQTDMGEILLKMALALESVSYQESFHGAFSSANAAVNLITERIEQE